MTMPLRALVIAPAPDAARMTEELGEAGFNPICWRVETQADYRAQLDAIPDVVLAEARLPEFDALLALRHAQGQGLDIPFLVIITSPGDEGVAAECMRQGAADYLFQDRLARLGPAVEQALELKHLRQGLAQAKAALRVSEDQFRLQSHAVGGRLARLAMLREIDHCISGGRSIQDVLDVVLDGVPEELGADAVAVSLLNEDQSSARVFAMRLPNGEVVEEEAFTLSEGLFQQLVKDKTLAIVPDLTQDPRVQMHPAVIRNRKLVSYLGVPLVALDRTIGILHLLTTKPKVFAAEDVDFLCSLAGQAVIGIENGRLSREARHCSGLVTQVRRAEEALDISETRLRDILDNAPVLVHVKNLEGRYLLVNRLWEERYGRRRGEVVGRCPHEVFPREQADTFLANHRRALDAGAALTFAEVAQHDDGTRTYLSSKFPLLNGGRPYAVCTISTDITEQKRTEEALRDSEALYHSLVESLPVCIVRKDLEGRFTFANQAFCADLGLPLELVIGRTDLDFYPKNLARKYRRDDARVIETGEVFEGEEEHLTAGSKRHVKVLKAPLLDARGRAVGVQVLFWDITDRKEAEEARVRKAAEFHVARRIQQRLFPTRTPSLPGLDIGGATYGFDIGGASYPAEAVGGDYFDYVRLADGSLGIAVGDVSGHGVGPALLMAEARAFLRACAQGEADVSRVLARVNRLLIEDIQDDNFITMLLARLEPGERSLVYASAGHAAGYLLDAAGKVKASLRSTGVPLGIHADSAFPLGDVLPLAPGDIVLFLTDGVAEARDPEGSAFGDRRALDVVRVYRDCPAQQIVYNLYHAVRAFSRNEPQVDDITATVLKVGAAVDGLGVMEATG